MSVLRPDYDDDPGRWRSWRAARDVHHEIAPRLSGPVLDLGCGDGRLAALLPAGVGWVGVDVSPAQLRDCPFRPVLRADLRALPFPAGSFATVTQLWCLYHLADPVTAIAEAARVLAPGGCYHACTAARGSDPELVPAGYPATTFDAEEAAMLVGQVFDEVEARPWELSVTLADRAEIRAYCRHHGIAADRAERVPAPLRLTKRGVLVSATGARR